MAGFASSRYYNDPALGQAFSNLADIFAPPSGSDAAGYANAAAKKAEAQRLADLFAYAQDPNFNQTQFDRMGVASGTYTPIQSYYAVDTTAATDRRGQDINAATSITNNRNTVLGSTISSLYGGLNPGEMRPAVPADVAALVGLPAIGAAQGNEKPLSETEMKAAILAKQPQAAQTAAVMGDVPVETIMGPDGPQIVYRNDAVGQTPYGKGDTFNYKKPDGSVGLGTVVGGTPVDAVTKQPIPPGSIQFNASLQGSGSETGLTTTANTTSATNREAEITSALNTLDLYEQLIRDNPGAVGLAGLIRGTAQNVVQTAGDLAAAFGKDAPQISDAANEIRAGLSTVAPELFDPSIPEAAFLQGTIAYAIARTENPQGEVSRQAYDRALERINGGGLLSNQASVLANINAYRKVLEAGKSASTVLRDPTQARTDTSFQGAPTGPRTTSSGITYSVEP